MLRNRTWQHVNVVPAFEHRQYPATGVLVCQLKHPMSHPGETLVAKIDFRQRVGGVRIEAG